MNLFDKLKLPKTPPETRKKCWNLINKIQDDRPQTEEHKELIKLLVDLFNGLNR
ncbi:hypothetical protein [Candidatus Borrarchaeum sp.]|uniref:hypothetical protein n=1 Tax=Candidatus Borrarchaeum sp. TaxID=2846742 RepID=UPI00257DD4E4|nr:hypothetical protein [Candidatus Borrarchaeum sp.]